MGCAGPILFLIGLIMLVGPNDREEDVNAYNSAVSAYQGTVFPRLVNTDVSVDGVSASDHIIYTRSASYSTGDVYTFTATRNGVPTGSTTASIPRTANVRRSLRCTRDQCDRDCSFSDYECTQDSMRRYCSGTLDGRYTQTTSDYECDAGEVCGRCEYTGYLERACVPLVFGEAGLGRSDRYTSCEYPFEVYDYGPNRAGGRSSFELRVVAESDPYIELQRVTEGSNDFGPTEAQQRTTGLALLILGILLTVCVGAALGAFCRHHHSKREQDAHYV